MHKKHGAYYFVRRNKWTNLGRNFHDALIEYARLSSQYDKAALPDLISRSLADMKLTVVAGTYRNYRSCAKRVLEAFVEFVPQQIKPVHIAQFLDDNKATPGAANSMRTFLNGVFLRAVRWGIVETNPVRDIKQFRANKRDRYISAEEYASIKSHASPTLQCLMDIAYLTGQRIGDCLRIRYADITSQGLYVQQQKTNAKMIIEMTPELAEVIASAKKLHISVKGLTLFHRQDGSPIPYRTIHGQWKKACEDAGVDNAHFHDIRAAAATDAKSHGLDSKTLLGHTTESSHNRYLRDKSVKIVTPNKARNS